MQAKIFLSIFSVFGYLLGLYSYADNRTATQELEAAMTSLGSPVAHQTTLPSVFDGIEIDASSLNAAAAPKLDKQQTALTPVLVRTIRYFNQDISNKGAVEIAHLIEETANRHDVDPLLVTALVSQESAFYVDAKSPVGALGLGQLMPYTAADLGVDPRDPKENLDGCVRYLAQNLDAWAHTADPVGMALASYNAGPGAVAHYGGVPPYEETQNYVKIISSRYNRLLATVG